MCRPLLKFPPHPLRARGAFCPYNRNTQKLVSTMYHPFFQFVLPRIGQAALDVLLYVNFLQLPPLQLVSAWPVLYYGLPLLLMLLLAYISRDPLGLGIVFTGHLVTFYCIGTGIALLMRRVGGTPQFVWRIFWLDGITPWLLTAFIMWWGLLKPEFL